VKVRICYLELRTPGYEKYYQAARRAGVEFLRGIPSEVGFDEEGRPVLEVEDLTTGTKRLLRPDLVVLSSGMAPAEGLEDLARTLDLPLDEDGFVEVLDRKNRTTETRSAGIFTCGSSTGPKSLVECNTEASAVACGIHAFLASPGRTGPAASEVQGERCAGCGRCVPACPFNAITLRDRAEGAGLPPGVCEEAKVASIDPEACHACGICSANCPEMAVRHHLGHDVLLDKVRILVEGVPDPLVGFYCRECAGVAFSLSGMGHDPYPSSVRMVELPCLGRVSALLLVEAVRLGARGIFLAGCAEGRCQFRSGDASAAEQARQARALLESAGRDVPIETWHLCAVDRHSIGRRIRSFQARVLDGLPVHAPGPS
jgi:heterodisulfide reductase subunit A